MNPQPPMAKKVATQATKNSVEEQVRRADLSTKTKSF